MSENTPHILVDADACPVKEEVYKVAFRHEVPVTVVSNGGIRIPDHPLIRRTVVPADPDAADDWIAERANARSVICLLYTSPSPRDRQKSRMPSSA